VLYAARDLVHYIAMPRATSRAQNRGPINVASATAFPTSRPTLGSLTRGRRSFRLPAPAVIDRTIELSQLDKWALD